MSDSDPREGEPIETARRVRHYRAGGVSLVVDLADGTLPRLVHWGADLGELGSAELADLVAVTVPPVATSVPDVPVRPSILPEQSSGWLGSGGLAGHRSGRRFSTAFRVTGYDDAAPARTDDRGGSGPRDLAHRIVVTAHDTETQLSLTLEIELTDAGLLRTRARVGNIGVDDYTVDALTPVLPVPREADEILDLTGRHLRERSPQRHAFTIGTHTRESWRGRTGHDASLVLVAGRAGFGFREGEAWAVHTAWSGNHRTLAERMPSGDSLLAGGEALLPGEVILAPGEHYASPWLYGSWGRGLDAISARFHAHIRSRETRERGPRPVLLNVWEAVYFEHDLDTLTELADRAAEVGVERYVLDDGWFRGRRDDSAGLGDWIVDETVWPNGLTPLIDHVTSLGMEFGLWFEPEMVNPDSDLAREHPDWILSAGERGPLLARHQHALNLTIPAAYDHILGRVDAILSENAIDFVKWDHNRDLLEAATRSDGRAAVHEQTLAFYRMLDELRSRHPHLEIESCASGGGRIDLEVLERTDRVWTSDTIDALERQQIQRYTQLLVPPEIMGAHVGAERSHTTGRRHDLAFRAGTALFGHLGIEWDLREATTEQLDELAGWVALHKRLRPLLHSGETVRADHPDPALLVHGVVANDRSEAVFALVMVQSPVASPPGRVRLPGLDADARYRVERVSSAPAPVVPLAESGAGPGIGIPAWWATAPVLSGTVLAEIGVQAPALFPEQLELLHVHRV
ncbi:alpha-galactosidase [Marisediminicola sp. LYQ134]|uniref:alpha-galactosidase n=1 Tax=Marisediminicola sp. LYQ134 TaxID=3391061 RepID=UPI0039838B82